MVFSFFCNIFAGVLEIQLQNSELKVSPQDLYFSKALFEGLIFGVAYFRRGLYTEGNLRFKIPIWLGPIHGGKSASQNQLVQLIVGRKFLTVICRKVLLNLALRTRTQTFLKRSHASSLSIQTKKILHQPRLNSELRKQG